MAELENLLLQAAGRTVKPESKNKSHDSDNPKFNKKNNNMIKREIDNANNLSGDQSDTSAPSFGSDLYRDEHDKKMLSKLCELDREMILETRSTRLDEYRLKKRAREKTTEENMSTSQPSSRFDALNELKAKRMKQQQQQQSESYLSSLEHFIPLPEVDSSGSDNIKDWSDDLLSPKSSQITYEDAREITIRRSKLSKWLNEPFFEKTVIGCFVRVGIGNTRNGPKYRLCMVKNVDATDINKCYKLEGRKTYKWLNCVWGNESSAARWQMAMISNSPPTLQEFNEWLIEMERNEAQIPCQQHVDDKLEQIQKTKTFVYSADAVKKMLKHKNSNFSRPLNVAVEKAVLKNNIAIAESSENETYAENLRVKLREMEELSRQVKPSDKRGLQLLEMNRKNKEENFKNAFALKQVDTSKKCREKTYDPFSRRLTRPDVGEKVVAHDEDMKKAEVEGKLVDTSPPVDHAAELCAMHDFDLPICLDGLNRYREIDDVCYGVMERKRKIEVAYGNRLVYDDGRRHALAISINDYKRRRGLL